MEEWFASISMAEQFLVVVALFTGLIFLFQFVSTLMGLSADVGVDIDDASGVDFGDIFTIRNGVTFLMGFSLGGLMSFEWGLSHPAFVVVIGSLVGGGFVAVSVLIFVAMSRLKNSGNINFENAIGETGRVTLPVPAARSGVGKVMIPIQGRLKEYHSVTDGEELKRNAEVVVLDVNGGQLLVASSAG